MRQNVDRNERASVVATSCGRRTHGSTGGISTLGKAVAPPGISAKSAGRECECASLPSDARGGGGAFRQGSSVDGSQVALPGGAVRREGNADPDRAAEPGDIQSSNSGTVPEFEPGRIVLYRWDCAGF